MEVAQGLMGTLNRNILVRGPCTSWMDVITKFLKMILEFRIVIKFTTVINHDVLVRDVKDMVLGKPRMKPLEGDILEDMSDAIKLMSSMISEKKIAGLTIETSEIFLARFIFGLLADESKVNRQTLIGQCSLLDSAILVHKTSLEIYSEADRTSVKKRHGGLLELRNVINHVPVCIAESLNQDIHARGLWWHAN
jgi:hypothetical protein